MIDLFSGIDDDEKSNIEIEINENEFSFPLHVRNNASTTFTCYKNEKQFEQITINSSNESFRGSLLIGFNEQLHDMNYDLKLWLPALLRTHTIITQQQYEDVFNMFISGREEFLTDGAIPQYITRELSERQKTSIAKFKWRAPEY